MTGEQNITLLVDTGADVSLFKRNKIDPQQIVNRSNICRIKGVTEGCTNSIGTTNANIFIEDYVFSHNFHIVDRNFPIPADGILGRDFIVKYRCQLDYNKWNMTLETSDRNIILPIYNSPEDDVISVPPRCEVIRTLNSLQNVKQDSVVLNEEIAPGVFVAGSIISNKSPYLRIMNTNFESIVIKNPKITYSSLENFDIFYANSSKEASKPNRNDLLLKELNISSMPDFVKPNMIALCQEFSDIFSLENDSLTTNNFYRQKLRLTDNTPVYIKNYRTPYSQVNEINKQVEKMLKDEIIEPSQSEYNSPILLVPKKSNDAEKSWRLVVDFRHTVNKKLCADKFPISRIDEILDQLGRAKWFSTLDLKAGFHQIPLEDSSRDITSFSTNTGSYRFTRLPFGLKISPNSFQRMMSIAFAGLTSEKIFLYMDDLICIGCSENHHLKNLKEVFETCRKFNLKLNPKKCMFFQNNVTYLGHKVTSNGVLPDETKYDIIRNYPQPKSSDDARRFVAFCNYYRRFIKNFAEIARPLNKLLKKNSEFLWTEECQESFGKLKKLLLEPQILQYPDFDKPFLLTTDASKEACGAVLSQNFGGEDLPIAFASRGFTKGEINKSTIEKELAAIHWGINYFRPYLYGNKFFVKSDHRPLVYLFSMKNPSSKLTRMRLDLEEYDFEIEYIKGKNNVLADALSRITIEELKDINSKSAQIFAVTTRSMARIRQTSPNIDTNLQEVQRPDMTPKIIQTDDNYDLFPVPTLKFIIKPDYLRIIMEKYGKKKFSAERMICFTNDNFSLGKVLSQLQKMASENKLEKLKLNINDEIFKSYTISDFKLVGQDFLENTRIYLYREPKVITEEEEKLKLIQQFHDNPLTGGHCGQKRLLKKLRSKCRWKNMSRDVATYVKNCKECQLNKSKIKHIEPMVITPTPQQPFDIVSIDTIGPFTKSENNNAYAVTIQCELTKYVVIAPVPNKEALTVAKAIVENFILVFGPMKEIRTDMGTEYRNEVLEKLSNILNISHKFSTAYHHESIGGCERNHRVLNEYLTSYINETHTDWDKWINFYAFCYNTTPGVYHEYTPFELVFGRKAEIPNEVLTKIDPWYNIDAYYQEVRYRMQISHQRARDFLVKVKQNRKIKYDVISQNLSLQKGDLVMLKNENRTKFDAWFKGPFTVVSTNGVNCTVKSENGKELTVHKNRVQKFNIAQ